MSDNPFSDAFKPRRALGRTGFAATALGIGDLADRSVPLDECVATARRAIEAGLNVIDTAPGYEAGYSEQIIGAAVRGCRDQMFVIDKIDDIHQPVAPQVEASLRTLGLDVVDLFLFHGVSRPEDWSRLAADGGGMAQLGECISQGKCRFRGISSHHPAVLREAINSGLCDVVMFAVGPFADRRYADKILPLAGRKGVGTVCFKAFGAGKLVCDTTGYGQPLQQRPRGKISSGGPECAAGTGPLLPHLSIGDCVHYTLTCDPDVALLGLSFPNEQDAAFTAALDFTPLAAAEMVNIRARASEAVRDKGPCWWNPP